MLDGGLVPEAFVHGVGVWVRSEPVEQWANDACSGHWLRCLCY